jgi:hypothetical protein
MKTLVKTLSAAGFAGLLSACAPFNVSLNVPPGSPEDNTCGAVTGQGVLRGYPNPPNPPGGCIQTQSDVFNAILAGRIESIWDADPAGMRAALAGLCPPPGGSWQIVANSDPAVVMHSVAFYITHNRYPVAALLNTAPHAFATHDEHWVTIKGIGTDVDPTIDPRATVNLEYVWFNDPAVAVGELEVERYVAASEWNAEFQAVTKLGSAYTGKFVAIIEPPPKPGRAVAKPKVLTGQAISEERALRSAARWVRKLGLAKLGPYRDLARSRPLPPTLVDRERGGYYLVPYAALGKEARFAVLVNAYTGEFQEVGAFKPRRFLAVGDAEKLALSAIPAMPAMPAIPAGRAIPAGPAIPANVRAEAVSAPADGGSRYQPLWRIRVDGRAIDVTQGGRVVPNRPATPLPDPPSTVPPR